MAIPIKCPGCQAAFDVPDTLAGKTIRCTSCKTQLPVPAARPVPVPVAKAAPVPVAKVAPVAKPAPVAKAVVAELDEDDKKTKSTKLVSKRRPADDDEDDDDDDDRPVKKKGKKSAKGGGSNGTLLLVGGGVVGLLALIGVAVWLIMGSGDKKETAGSGTSTPSSSPTMPSGGMPNAPGGMPGRPGPAGGADSWQTIQADGYSFEMPGQPETNKPIPGAGPAPPGAKTYVLLRGANEGLFVMAADLPGGAGLTPAQTRLALDELVKKVKAETGGFGGGFGGKGDARIELSSEFTQDGVQGAELTLGSKAGGTVGVLRFAIVRGKLLVYGGGSDNYTSFNSTAERFVKSMRFGGPSGPGGPMMSPGSPMGPGNPIAMNPSGPPAGNPMMTPGNPMMTPGNPIAMNPPGMTPSGPPLGNPMMTPGGPIAMNPSGPPAGNPMMIPGNPMIPGGQPFPGGQQPPPGGPFGPGGNLQASRNQGPPGSSVRPQLAHKIDAFYAIAFDPAKKDTWTISPRTDPKNTKIVLGTLYRYTYPEFKKKAEFNLPHLATRAVIDSDKGVLYTATATDMSPTALAQLAHLPFDRAAAHGDVEIYDLEPARSGKLGNGDALKPIGTLKVGGTIRGLELSADGKFVYVLATKKASFGAPPKSTVMQYDTADRKLIKERDLPDHAGAWDAVKSADGKSLLIMEMPRASATGAHADKHKVWVFDMEAMKADRSFTIQGGTTSLATQPGGGMVAASKSMTAGAQPHEATLHAIDPSGGVQEVAIPPWHVAHNTYAQFTPDGKTLFVSSTGDNHNGQLANSGVDVYAPDAADPTRVKHVVAIRSVVGANSAVPVGGLFHISPDGELVAFQTGVILAVQTATVDAPNADTIPELVTAGGQGGMQGGIGQPGMQPGMNPGMQPGMNPGMRPGMQPGMNPGMRPGGGRRFPQGQPGGIPPGNPMNPQPGM